jgi:hypothetical protein
MKVFGPFYPAPLQASVTHAESFCKVLTGYEVNPPTRKETFVAWLSGREGEVVRVVQEITSEWRAGSITAERASMQVERYLRDLHEALVHLGVLSDETGLPECCVVHVNMTVASTDVPDLSITTTADATPMMPVEMARSGTVIQPIEGIVVDDIQQAGGRR